MAKVVLLCAEIADEAKARVSLFEADVSPHAGCFPVAFGVVKDVHSFCQSSAAGQIKSKCIAWGILA